MRREEKREENIRIISFRELCSGAPLFFYTILFLSGNIIAGYFGLFKISLLLISFLNLITLPWLVIRFDHQNAPYIRALIALQFFIMGQFSIFLNNKTETPQQSIIAEKSVEIRGKIVDVGLTKNGFTRIDIAIDREIVLIYSDIDRREIFIGDYIKSTITPQRLSYSYDNKRFTSCFTPSREIDVIKAKKLTIREFFSNLGMKFSFWLETIIEDREVLGIVRALTIGEKTGLDQELKDAYSKSGVMHLLALSGLHVGVIYSILSWLLSFLGRNRISDIVRRILIIAVLWLYQMITNGSPSIMRAVIMATVYELSGALFRPKNGLNALSISAIIIITLDPSAPRSIGFQLSFIAMLSIFFIYPYIKNCFRSEYRLISNLWNNMALTLSCQIATAPFILYYFNSFPTMFLVGNIIAIPLASLIMALIVITLICCKIPYLGEISLTILSFLIKLLNLFVSKISI